MKLLWTLPFWLCATAPLSADVTLRYDMKMTSPVSPASGAQAQKAMQDHIFGGPLRMKNGKSWTNIGRYTYILDYATKQATLLDQDHKSFTKLPAAEFSEKMGDKMSAAIPPMPDDVVKSMAAMKTSVDSKKTGRTDTIQGIQAEEREVVMSVEMPIPAPGAPQTSMHMKLVIEIWTAKPEEALRNQAVREFTGYSIYANQFMNPLAGMQKMMGKMPGFTEVFKPLFGELSRSNAMMLRCRMAMYMTLPPAARGAGNPDTPMMQITQEAVEVSSAPVDESIFQVPADFQAVPADDFLKSMVAEQMSGLGGRGKQ